MARFAPLYDVPIEDASVEVRCSFDVSDKLGLDGPGAAFEEVAFGVAMGMATALYVFAVRGWLK